MCMPLGDARRRQRSVASSDTQLQWDKRKREPVAQLAHYREWRGYGCGRWNDLPRTRSRGTLSLSKVRVDRGGVGKCGCHRAGSGARRRRRRWGLLVGRWRLVAGSGGGMESKCRAGWLGGSVQARGQLFPIQSARHTRAQQSSGIPEIVHRPSSLERNSPFNHHPTSRSCCLWPSQNVGHPVSLAKRQYCQQYHFASCLSDSKQRTLCSHDVGDGEFALCLLPCIEALVGSVNFNSAFQRKSLAVFSYSVFLLSSSPF